MTPIPTPFSGSNPASTITLPSRSALPCCWRASAPSSASTNQRGRDLDHRPPYVPAKLEALLNLKGNKVRLTEKETSILRYLYRAGQRPASRETLLQQVWGYNSGVTTHTLETHIYRLRQKIEKDAAAPAILVTEAGGHKRDCETSTQGERAS